MKKQITIYELLGLIKDDKAPKFVRYDNRVWQYKEQFDDYFNDVEYLIGDGFDNWDNAKTYLNEKVEIIEEDKPIIEKIKINKYNFHNTNHSKLLKNQETLGNKLNEIIDYLEKTNLNK